MKHPNHHHQLVKDYIDGDRRAAQKLYELYSKAMYNTLVRISGNTEDAQDLLQDAFVKAFKNMDSFNFESTFGAWLKRIVINTGLEFLRKKKVNFEELSPQMTVMDEVDDKNELAPEMIHKAIKKLPPGTRTVVTLYLLEGMTHDEIAEDLAISPSTSKTQYMRGKSMLREQLKDKIHG
eukprot:gnl/TRDRNA2_/TRDRNA2_69250_c0_seq1.p1 gnl/TRDRNA2_/TRDRNA2_69250_c0~~gnl/TRDRNA2_/TRDRNA2_69250_c0_seq1.p1  ORF type:complete len:179 (+),score=17.12 gnl/TRDRNA2_/TRDRNA2_69250_c0_seq1:26-562(+)